jgi:hypothetical protein
MIITQAMINELTCEESIAWFNAHPEYFNLPRKEFRKRLREAEKLRLTPNDWWADWADENFSKAEAIIHNKKLKRLGIYRTIAPNENPQEFDNIDDAIVNLKALRNSHIKTEDKYFQIQIRQQRGELGYEILNSCDITQNNCDLPNPDAYFSTFNIFTGLYEDFKTYDQARNKLFELRTLRNLQISNSYAIEEKIAEVEDPELEAPSDFIVVESITGRKTDHLNKLNRISNRPPKRQK